jgi:hypothetical protein
MGTKKNRQIYVLKKTYPDSLVYDFLQTDLFID